MSAEHLGPEEDKIMDRQGSHMTKTARRTVTALRIAGALFGAVAAPVFLAPAAHAQAASPLPDVRQFREGDAWDAFDAELSRRTGMPSYQAYVVSHGRWIHSTGGLQSFIHPNSRSFTDLAGQQPKFPDHWTGGFWAAPDGQLYMPTDRANTWARAPMGYTVDIANGGKFTVAERMTQAQADELNRRFAGGGLRAHLNLVTPRPTAAHAAPRTIYCPNGRAFSTAVSGPVGFRPGEISLAAACAAFAPSPVRR